MNRLGIAAILWATTSVAAAAEEIEPLDGAFLEYLANMEGDSDDWTLLAEAEEGAPEAEGKPAPSAKPAQPSKEAAKPAEDER